MKTLKVDITKLWTKSEYARKLKVSPAAIDRKCKEDKLKVVRINGTELILLD